MNNLKNIVLVVILFTLTMSYGQRKDHEKIKSLKIAFFTEKLDLSSDEAKAFWPMYNEHEEKMNALRKRERTQLRNKKVDLNALNEEEAGQRLNAILELEQLKDDERIGFIQKVSTVLSAKKTLLLIKAEEEFKRQLIRQYRKKRGGGRR